MQLLLHPAKARAYALGDLPRVAGRRAGAPGRVAAAVGPERSWSKNRRSRARIQTASGRCGSGARGQVGAGGVAEVADPVRVRGSPAGARPRGRRRRRRRPPPPAPPACRVTSPRAGVVGQRHVVLVQPPDHRPAARPLARAAAVEPEAAGVGGRHLAGSTPPGRSRRVQEVRDHLAPCSDRIDSGWNCTPSSGSDRCRTPITTRRRRRSTRWRRARRAGRRRPSEW